jgi:hypothetical protein
MKPLSRQSATEKHLQKTYRLSSSPKPNKPQYSLKIKIASFTGSFWSLYDGKSQLTQKIIEVGGSFLEPPAPTSALIRRHRLSSSTQTSQCKSYKVVLNVLNPRRMNLLMRRPHARCILQTWPKG